MTGPILCRGVRGAVTVEADTDEAILTAARALLQAIAKANDIDPRDIASVIFSTTPDLQSVCPALAARRDLGWSHVPLLCIQEMHVEGALPRTVRVLIHWNTAKSQDEIAHIYQGEAKQLRPDLT